jgi:hypothetical protein
MAVRAGLRIGALAAVLMGPAAAIGLRWRVPGLVTGVADAVVLAMYLGVLFGLAAAIFAAVAVLAGRAIARRSAHAADFSRHAGRAATGVGLVVGLVCLVYLTLWWRSASGLAGSRSIAWSLGALGVAAAISVLLGYAVRLTVLALAATLGEPHAPVPKSRTAWARTLLPLGGAALAGSLALLVLAPGSMTTPAAPPLTVVPTGQRLVVLAIDGVDVDTLDRLRSAGDVPALARLMGSAAVEMPSDTDRDPARVWTTIATAQPPERHGVRALESRAVAGLEGRLRADAGGWRALTTATDLIRLTRPAIASGDERLIPAFWEVAARAGLRTAVVHWWATWPAPDDLGVVLSDRAILRLEHGGPQDAEIAPAALYDALTRTFADRHAAAQREAESVTPAGATGDVVTSLLRSAELDATIAALASDPALGSLDLLVVYLPGLDIATHAMFPVGAGVALDAAGAAERVSALDRYYRFLDRLIADTPAFAADPARTMLLVTQPGRVARPGSGLLALSGAPAGSSSSARGRADVTTIAPTVLYALGVPVADDLAGTTTTSLFLPAFTTAHAARTVATYGSRHASNRRGTGQPLNQEMIERMRSLGYVR